MEIENNSGIISICESRDVAEKLKNHYRNEYKRIKDEQKKANSTYFKRKIGLVIGNIGAHIGLLFTSKPVKKVGKIVTKVASLVTLGALKIKNKHDNANFNKQLKQLEANFINCEGEFKEIAIQSGQTHGELIEEEELSESFTK